MIVLQNLFWSQLKKVSEHKKKYIGYNLGEF